MIFAQDLSMMIVDNFFYKSPSSYIKLTNNSVSLSDLELSHFVEKLNNTSQTNNSFALLYYFLKSESNYKIIQNHFVKFDFNILNSIHTHFIAQYKEIIKYFKLIFQKKRMLFL